MSTSPSPFRSNILKAISKFLWGAALKTRNNKDQLKKIKAQKGARVTSSEWLYPKAIFHKYYKCPRTAFTKGLQEDVEGEGDVCWTKFIPFTDGKSKNVRHHLIFLMRNQQKMSPEWELKPFGCGVIQIWPADVPLVPAERSLCFVKQPVASSSPGLWVLLSDSALVTANLNKSLPTLSQSSYKAETTHELEITSWNPNRTAQDLVFHDI